MTKAADGGKSSSRKSEKKRGSAELTTSPFQDGAFQDPNAFGAAAGASRDQQLDVLGNKRVSAQVSSPHAKASAQVLAGEVNKNNRLEPTPHEIEYNRKKEERRATQRLSQMAQQRAAQEQQKPNETSSKSSRKRQGSTDKGKIQKGGIDFDQLAYLDDKEPGATGKAVVPERGSLAFVNKRPSQV